MRSSEGGASVSSLHRHLLIVAALQDERRRTGIGRGRRVRGCRVDDQGDHMTPVRSAGDRERRSGGVAVGADAPWPSRGPSNPSTSHQLSATDSPTRQLPESGRGGVTRTFLAGARGFEPLTSSVSGKRSPPELSARSSDSVRVSRRGPELNRCTGFCRPLPNHSATPPKRLAGHAGPQRSLRDGRKRSPRDRLRWSGRRDSNPRPPPWQGGALPAEPRPRVAPESRCCHSGLQPEPQR